MLIYGRIETPTKRHPMIPDVTITIPDTDAAEVCADMMREMVMEAIENNFWDTRHFSVSIALPRGVEPDDEMRAEKGWTFGEFDSDVYAPLISVANGIYEMLFEVDRGGDWEVRQLGY
jgi:hypothetical protein